MKVLKTALGPLILRSGSPELKRYNIERVRGYLERNLGCTQKEVQRALNLSHHTVQKAVASIREEQRNRPARRRRDRD